MKFKFYEYEKCSTCIKAKKWLSERNQDFECIPIRENPPCSRELRRLLVSHANERKKLLNTSSKDYRDPAVKDALPNMSDTQLFEFLGQNGNLVKRPALIARDFVLQGFKPEVWAEKIG
jgi:arsenate reductase